MSWNFTTINSKISSDKEETKSLQLKLKRKSTFSKLNALSSKEIKGLSWPYSKFREEDAEPKSEEDIFQSLEPWDFGKYIISFLSTTCYFPCIYLC